ncbi:MAG: hypothetical protein ABL961_03525 [Vicinamibacterales bacterium]
MRATIITFAAAMALAACSRPAPEKPATPEVPPPAVQSPSLIPGVGNHHHAIATASPEAQRYFDQGFDLVFGFNHEEAARSFRRAAELDPKAPMPLWGRNGRSLFGLHESLVKQGKGSDAEWVKRAFDEAWKSAEVALTLEAL